MAVLVADPIERPAALFGHAEAGHRDVGGGPTLDDAIVEAWEGLVAHAPVACPLCGGALRPRSAGGEAVGGRCDRCATTLA